MSVDGRARPPNSYMHAMHTLENITSAYCLPCPLARC